MRFERSVHVFSLALGVGGILDLLEVDTQTGALRPVEYKRGRPKKDNWDKAKKIYNSMLRKLCEYYSIKVRSSIAQEYNIKVF